MLKNRTKNIYINISFERKNSCEFYSKMQFKKKKGEERGGEREKREINTIFPSKVNLTNRQLEFARLVAGKIARLPTRRAVPSISKTETEIRRFLSFLFCFV